MRFQNSSTGSQKQEYPLTIFLEPTASTIVFGCAGIPRSIPRIESIIHIRTANGSPFLIRSVSIVLITRQKVTVPAKLGSTEAFKEFKIFEDPMAFRPVNGFSQNVLGVDLPVMIPVPKDVIPSGYSSTLGVSTIHYLAVKVVTGESSGVESSYIDTFPVVIKTYDTLPLYRQYNEPLVEQSKSADNQVLAQVTMPTTSVGPGDRLELHCKLSANSANNKVKKHLAVKQITFQLKENLECYDGGLPPKKENKLYTTTLQMNKELNTQGVVEKLGIKFPQHNDNLEVYYDPEVYIIENEVAQDNETTVIESTNIATHKIVDRIPEGLPITHLQSFTASGKFYSIKFELILKIKLSKAKDFDVHLPLTVCPFDRKSSQNILQWIMHECEVAKARFGREFIDRFFSATSYDAICNLMNRYKSAPTVYKNCKEDWIKLGFLGEKFGTGDTKNSISYIE
ncbi:hypothetical protein KGF57_004190 [Candida theae]|uniref:Arrestin C-terminal-like domain-containing protein n=1 Tax=Candida theae TaxID=1198502 RepID=A0AAD5BCQ7_9ASCO|nr:uncharacterized protein KGF57_004190 [Candida theae]KAI5952098.1 hypothetical protein KGF57_004190 [Candida theae]